MKINRTELSNGEITLRAHKIEDVLPYFESVRESMNELSPWMWWCHSDYSIDETKTWINTLPESWDVGESLSGKTYMMPLCSLSYQMILTPKTRSCNLET